MIQYRVIAKQTNIVYGFENIQDLLDWSGEVFEFSTANTKDYIFLKETKGCGTILIPMYNTGLSNMRKILENA